MITKLAARRDAGDAGAAPARQQESGAGRVSETRCLWALPPPPTGRIRLAPRVLAWFPTSFRPHSRSPAAGATPAGPASRRDAGFTLLEVLVAFAILSIAVVASIQGFAQGLRLLRLSGDHQQAILLADQKVREVVRPAEEPERKEDTEGPFKWERTITVVPAPDLTRTRATEQWRVYRIEVKVAWGETRHVEVATLRTSASSAPTPGARR